MIIYLHIPIKDKRFFSTGYNSYYERVWYIIFIVNPFIIGLFTVHAGKGKTQRNYFLVDCKSGKSGKGK